MISIETHDRLARPKINIGKKTFYSTRAKKNNRFYDMHWFQFHIWHIVLLLLLLLYFVHDKNSIGQTRFGHNSFCTLFVVGGSFFFCSDGSGGGGGVYCCCCCCFFFCCCIAFICVSVPTFAYFCDGMWCVLIYCNIPSFWRCCTQNVNYALCEWVSECVRVSVFKWRHQQKQQYKTVYQTCAVAIQKPMWWNKHTRSHSH